MFTYQKFPYKSYRVLTEDGKEITVSREECFAPGEMPTEDNPYKQRWYYSPDHTLAIRLPRGEKGEALYLINSADLKGIEREEKRKRSCVGESNANACSVSCANCRFNEHCILANRENNGRGCKKKCEDCSYKTMRLRSMDQPIGEDDNGDAITEEFDGGEEVEAKICRQEDEREYGEYISNVFNSLSSDEKILCRCLKAKIPLEKIAEILGVHVNTVINRREKLKMKFTVDAQREEHEKNETVKSFISALGEDEKLLYECIRREMKLEEIALLLNIPLYTIKYRKKKLKKKFAAAGLEKYF
ncbi:MAG: hypothetical protein LUG52_01235 [Clostridia bacterium]|nr:hypothetical protein [Clostridia bacterium]